MIKNYFLKKVFIIFILILLSIIFIYSGIKNTGNEKNTVVFWTLQLSSYDKFINNIISEFEQNNPDVKIKWIDIPYSEGEKRTLAAILTDNPPDLINLTPDFSLMLAQKNVLYLIDKNDLEQFKSSLIETLKYGDKYFGIPFYATSAVTLYNKSILSSDIPETYDDLFKVIPPVNKFITMINFTENDTLLKLLNKYNINSYENIDSEKSIILFKTFKNLYDKGYIPKESVTQTHRDSLEKYMSGQLALIVTGANFINMIKENAPSVYADTGITTQLTGDTGLYDYSLMNFVIPKRAKNKENALKFCLFFTNKKNQLDFAKMTPILPVNKEALDDDYFKLNTGTMESKARKISAEQLNYLLQPPLSEVQNKKDLNTLSSNYIQEILINNSDIRETLKRFSDDWKNL